MLRFKSSVLFGTQILPDISVGVFKPQLHLFKLIINRLQLSPTGIK